MNKEARCPAGFSKAKYTLPVIYYLDFRSETQCKIQILNTQLSLFCPFKAFESLETLTDFGSWEHVSYFTFVLI